jgi:hypothetical protein
VIDVVAGVDAAAVPFDLGVRVVAAAGRIEATLMQPVAGFGVVIDVDGQDGLIASGLFAVGRDSSTVAAGDD